WRHVLARQPMPGSQSSVRRQQTGLDGSSDVSRDRVAEGWDSMDLRRRGDRDRLAGRERWRSSLEGGLIVGRDIAREKRVVGGELGIQLSLQLFADRQQRRGGRLHAE